MARFQVKPYDGTDSLASWESERQSSADTFALGSILKMKDLETSNLAIGDVIALFPVFGNTKPQVFNVTSGNDPNDFVFDVGLAIRAAEEAFEPDFFATDLAVGANQFEPATLIRTNHQRRIQTIRESLTFTTSLDAFRAADLRYEVVLTVKALPIDFDFTLTFLMRGSYGSNQRLDVV